MKTIYLLALAGLIAGSVSAQQQVTDGGFDSTGNPSGGWAPYLPGSPIGPWTVDTTPAGGVQLLANGIISLANNGTCILQLTDSGGSPYTPGGISQTITTVPGTTYAVSMQVCGRYGDSPFASFSFGDQSFSFDAPSKTWTTVCWLITADSTSTVIDISGSTASSAAVLIDNVSVSQSMVADGDFELTGSPSGGWATYNPGKSLGTWTVDTTPSGGVQLFGPGTGVNDGTCTLQLTSSGGSPYTPGGISQTIPTVPGTTYAVSMNVIARYGASTSANANFSFGDQSFAFAAPATWTTVSWLITADSTSTLINITGSTASSEDIVIDNVSVALTAAPSITTDVQSGSNYAGNTTSFSVAVSGLTPNYQWYFNNAPLTGATNAALVLTNIQAVNAGNYQLIITNVQGAATSSVASLVVWSNLTVNGDFENPQIGKNTWQLLPAGSTNLANWTVDTTPPHGVQVLSPDLTAYDGSQTVQLTGGDNVYAGGGGLHQTIATVPGLGYLISVDVWSRWGNLINGVVGFGSQNLAITATTSTFVTVTVSGTATSTNTVLDLSCPAASGSPLAVMIIDNVRVTPATASPVFAPAAGTYSGAQNITLGCPTPGSTIYYSTDGWATTNIYTSAINIPVDTTETIQAFATNPSYLNSAEADASFTTISAALIPTFTPPAGSYIGAQTTVTMAADAGSTVFYTTDGITTPDNTSPHGVIGSGTATFVLAAPTNVTIMAYATNTGKADSSVASATYVTVIRPAWINPNGGSWPDSSSWLSGIIAGGMDATADFTQLALNNGVAFVTLDGDQTVGTLLFDDQASPQNGWEFDPGSEVNGPGKFVLSASSGSAVISNNCPVTITARMEGPVGFTKLGANTLTWTGSSGLGGGIVISQGTLVMAQSAATLATNSTVTIASGAYLNLADATVTNIVRALVTNSVAAANGVYGAANSSGFITGAGYLQVGLVLGPSSPATITNSISGNTLTFAWPAGQNWRLVSQTNNLSPSGWSTVTGVSDGSAIITIDPNQPSVFYQLVYP